MINAIRNAHTLRNIQFCVEYGLATRQVTKSTANNLIKMRVQEIVNNNTVDNIDPEVIAFHKGLGRMANKKMVCSLRTVLNEFIKNIEAEAIFFSYVFPESTPHQLWIYGNLPKYFIDHPIDGLETRVVPSFEDIKHEAMFLYFSAESVTQSCTVAGYLKQPFEVRFMAPRYDVKLKNKIANQIITLNLITSKMEKITLKDNIQEWRFFILPNSYDKEFDVQSPRGDEELKSIVEEMANGKTYIACLDNEPVSSQGFRTLADVQVFVNRITPYIICLSSGKNPTHIYLGGTRHLLSFKNKKGDTLPLSKFRFNLKKS